VQLLFRPEQVILSSDGPPADVPLVGKGSVVEQSFAGPVRRVRLRLPHLRGTRQIAPALPFGEDALLVDATLPSETCLNDGDLWVGLRGWTILNKAEPRLLVYDDGKESTASLRMARLLGEELQARTTVLAVGENPEMAESMRVSFEKRQSEAGLSESDLRIRYGNPADQIAAEEAESLYEMLILASPPSKAAPLSRIARFPRLEARSRVRKLGGIFSSTLHYTDIPMLVVKGGSEKVERVLICTAAGEPGKNDVAVGGRLAQRLGASVTLLYVNSKSNDTDALTRLHLDRALATLRALDVESKARIRNAETAASGILEESESGDHDLIVIGSYGPRLNSFFDLNEVMLEVLLRADRPVLIVPTDRV
jgi:nucleotide-binding universal stress UspA family protein